MLFRKSVLRKQCQNFPFLFAEIVNKVRSSGKRLGSQPGVVIWWWQETKLELRKSLKKSCSAWLFVRFVIVSKFLFHRNAWTKSVIYHGWSICMKNIGWDCIIDSMSVLCCLLLYGTLNLRTIDSILADKASVFTWVWCDAHVWHSWCISANSATWNWQH